MAENNKATAPTTAPTTATPERTEYPPQPEVLSSNDTQVPGTTQKNEVKQPESAQRLVPNLRIQEPDLSAAKREPLKQDGQLIKAPKPLPGEGSASPTSVKAIPATQSSIYDVGQQTAVSNERLVTEEHQSLSINSSRGQQSVRDGTGSSAASQAGSLSESTAGSPPEPDFRGYNILHLTNAEDQQMHQVQESTMHTLLDHLANSDPSPGLEIFFLPPIYTETSNTMILENNDALCLRLSVGLNVDPLFFTKKSWNANGFFQCQHGESGNHSSASRFLVKMLPAADVESTVAIPNYQWAYLSFCTLWREVGDGKASCVLVCFDDWHQHGIMSKIVDAFNRYPLQHIYESSSAMNDALLRGLTDVYDNALWRFRVPVRDIERRRMNFAELVEETLEVSLSNGNDILARYINMHELSRHVIHINETLQVAANTTHAMVVHARSLITAASPLHHTRSDNVVSGLRHSHDFLLNLGLRSKAFTDRINNEIALAYNIVSTHQLQNTKRIQEQSRDEGKDMTRIVTFLSLLFVPITVAQGFWSMRFIVLDEPSSQVSVTHDAWKFGATAGGLVGLSVLSWMAVHYGGWRPSIRSWLQFVRLFLQRLKGSGSDLPR
ncbi:corA-like mg2+ transporter protein domain-containing protein [Apiospora arundinis]|uniref:CorA-like mg2+ transporter protein domain-containing protein n=1 Tax=Apiospora arundinis TaxID=335852 RepID=A0ABR2HLK6_9PEZI